ncbi:peptidase M28 [Indibacter alkaliphilus LW1]|jgi:Zn-dependent M28 family amino/carboxypeptidase|uniref:Peptidase M28 n=1 Tax=Indibacter alkaliphilus (strain CCUG 57479 / KCTC 22604 / LW1) TaxID=1189612 RepID=S2DQ87_INDAL|nr:M20/M25/M40 family metallo-hydrolase [Indibacter alkaliphilus]EOZ91993.1 peptidase M28 [Indibacter alkaliphilus LW1]
MKNFFLILIFFSITLHSAVNAQSFDAKTLLDDLEYLASEKLQGRKTGTEGAQLAREYIKDRFEHLGLSSQYTDFTQTFSFFNRRELKEYQDAANIVGFVAGSDSERLIVVMAHYDHLGKRGDKIFYGADDNASGTAALLAIAEHFSKERPKHSMMFVALDAEEMGQHGSKAFVEDFPFPIDQVVLNINMDMVSRSEENILWAVGTYHYPFLKPVLEKVRTGSAISLEFGHDEPNSKLQDWTLSSDHAAFHKEGVPFIYFGVDDHEDYHKETDTFERIDQEFFIAAVELILAAINEFDSSLLNK